MEGKQPARGISTRRLALSAVVALTLAASLAVFTSPAGAHRAGKAIPSIKVQSQPVDPAGGLVHEITVTISDADSSASVSGAQVDVEAVMTVPHSMTTLPVRLAEQGSSGIYTGRLRYPMPADWTVYVSVSGDNVQAARAEAPVSVRLVASSPEVENAGGSERGSPGDGRVSVSIQGRLSTSDALPLASLAGHATFAAIWAIATVVLVLVAHPRTSRWFTEELRRSVLKKRSPVRMAAHIAGILLVATGISNGIVASPFRLLPTISSIKSGMEYPFGDLYLLVLAAKIVVLIALVLINRMPVLDPDFEKDEGATKVLGSTARFALGADLFLFPLLLILVILLKYLHVLVHVSLAVA